jgi:hypothetical protein
MDKIADKLLEHGVVGIFAALFIYLYVHKDKALQALQASFDLRMKEKDEAHAKEMNALMERHLTRSESWMAKYQENAQAQTKAITAIASNLMNPKGGHNG